MGEAVWCHEKTLTLNPKQPRSQSQFYSSTSCVWLDFLDFSVPICPMSILLAALQVCFKMWIKPLPSTAPGTQGMLIEHLPLLQPWSRLKPYRKTVEEYTYGSPSAKGTVGMWVFSFLETGAQLANSSVLEDTGDVLLDVAVFCKWGCLCHSHLHTVFFSLRPRLPFSPQTLHLWVQSLPSLALTGILCLWLLIPPRPFAF